jgi:copper homeostasis protein CutC
MNFDLLDNLKLDHEGMANAIAQDIERILTHGGNDTARLAEEVAKTPDDVVAWFDLGVAITSDVDMLD